MAIPSGYVISRRPSIQPGRPAGGPQRLECQRKGCNNVFLQESENDKYCCMGCKIKVRQAKEAHGHETRPRRKIKERRFWGDKWRLTLECGHIQLVPIADSTKSFRLCSECKPY